MRALSHCRCARLNLFFGQRGVVGIADMRRPVVAFGTLLVQRSIQANSLHQVRISDVLSSKSDEITSFLPQEPISMFPIYSDVQD